MFSKHLSLMILFILSLFSFTIAHAAPNVGSVFNGTTSFYGKQHHGLKTASGERFNMNTLTAAHRSLPLGCKIRVTNQSNGKSVVLKINDRGPFHGNRILDVSQAAAKQLDFMKQGIAKVDIEIISIPEKSLKVRNERRQTINTRPNGRIISQQLSKGSKQQSDRVEPLRVKTARHNEPSDGISELIANNFNKSTNYRIGYDDLELNAKSFVPQSLELLRSDAAILVK